MKWTQGVVQRKVIWGDGLFTLEVKVSGVDEFEPGQFLQLGIDLEGHHLHRPYSVASPHGEILDFFIVLVEDGALTPHLWKMETGDSIDVSTKAVGSFTLSHCPTGNSLWLLATGTGLAPYIAMLRTSQPWDRYQRVFVVHGVRHGADLAYQQEMADHKAQFGDRFEYVPVVSRESQAGGLHGRITTCIEDGSLEAAVRERLTTDCCVMMCGNPAMLDQTEAILGQRGLTRHRRKQPGQIVVERYW